MTFLTFIPLLIIIIAVGIIVFIFLKKLPVVAMVDVENLPEEREGKMKRVLVERRLSRRMQAIAGFLGRLMLPVGKWWKRWLDMVAGKVQRTEKRLRAEEQKERKEHPGEVIDEIERLIGEGDLLMKQDKLAEAEARFIEVVGMDPKNVAVYKKLAGIYELQKDWEHAVETWRFVDRLESGDVETLSAVGRNLSMQGEHRQAVDWFFRAVHGEPRNPRLLDLLIEESILARNKKLALEMLKNLHEVNPENKKLKEFKERIREIEEEPM